MSDIIIPNRHNVHIGDKEVACVLVHRETKRILTFCRNDPFSKSFESAGYELIELRHAYDYDKWAKKYREQASRESEAEDYAYLMREDKVRQQLRQQLIDRMGHCKSEDERRWIATALAALDAARKRKERYRPESFMVQEAVENSETKSYLGEDLVKKIVCNE